MGLETYVWYSGATDVTGKKIQESLGASGGTTKPTADKKIVLCWGTKTDADVVLTNGLVLNHPNKIRGNRDKVNALAKLYAGKVSVAPFTENFKLAGTKDYTFPLVARTKFHQGGAGFWLCLNQLQVANAVKEGAQYIQKYVNIKDEYRLHVVEGKVIYGVRKVQRDNHQEAFVEHYTELVTDKAVKAKANLDKATLDFIMKKLAAKFATGADMVIRSNTRGWKFSKVANENLDKGLVTEAINAVKTLGLNYAAVDCCIDDAGKAYVIECNSGPGLDGNTFDIWTTALKAAIADKVAPAPKAIKVEGPKPVGKIEPVGKIGVAAAKVGAGGNKAKLLEKLALMAQLAELADDDNDVDVIAKLMQKLK
jgi:glutathione synthase/RimK-type ligase-like ATP-grasp enzyme